VRRTRLLTWAFALAVILFGVRNGYRCARPLVILVDLRYCGSTVLVNGIRWGTVRDSLCSCGHWSKYGSAPWRAKEPFTVQLIRDGVVVAEQTGVLCNDSESVSF
jgi:hypothetical protein